MFLKCFLNVSYGEVHKRIRPAICGIETSPKSKYCIHNLKMTLQCEDQEENMVIVDPSEEDDRNIFDIFVLKSVLFYFQFVL